MNSVIVALAGERGDVGKRTSLLLSPKSFISWYIADPVKDAVLRAAALRAAPGHV